MKKKNRPMITTEKKVKQIMEYYYMSPSQMEAKEMSLCIETVPQEQIEVWRELNLMEVVLDSDSLIFQDAGNALLIRWIWNLFKNIRSGLFIRSVLKQEMGKWSERS